jgi:4-carboxymuconolactone decarboxylase
MAENSDFGTFGRYVETPLEQMPDDMRDAFEFTLKLRGETPHPFLLFNPPGLSASARSTITLTNRRV